LHKNAPFRFKEVSALLKQQVKMSLENNFQLGMPSEGALAIEKALNSYQKQVTI